MRGTRGDDGPLTPCVIPAELHGQVLKYVYHPSRLRVLKKCVTAAGTIVKIRKEWDGDYHVMLSLDGPYSGLLRAGQVNLVVEVIPHDQPRVHVKRVGTHVTVTGAHVYDTIHAWNEIHPVWSLT